MSVAVGQTWRRDRDRQLFRVKSIVWDNGILEEDRGYWIECEFVRLPGQRAGAKLKTLTDELPGCTLVSEAP